MTRLCLLALLAFGPPVLVSAEHLDRTQRTVTVPPGGALTIEVGAGAISVSGWDQDAASIEIVRRVPQERDLEREPIALEVDGARVRLRIVPPGGPDRDLRADVTARVPRRVTLERIHTADGDIELADLGGTVDAQTDRGAIAARGISGRTRLESTVGSIVAEPALGPDDSLHCRVFDGNATVRLAAPLDAAVELVSLNGRIASDFPLTIRDKFGPRAGSGTFGQGRAVLTVDVVTGDIALKRRSP